MSGSGRSPSTSRPISAAGSRSGSATWGGSRPGSVPSSAVAPAMSPGRYATPGATFTGTGAGWRVSQSYEASSPFLVGSATGVPGLAAGPGPAPASLSASAMATAAAASAASATAAAAGGSGIWAPAGSASLDSEFAELYGRAAASLQEWVKMIGQYRRLVELIGTGRDTHEHRTSLATVEQMTHHLMQETGAHIKTLLSSKYAKTERARVDSLREKMKRTMDEYQALEHEAAAKQKQFVALAQRQQQRQAEQRAREEDEDAAERQRIEERQWLLAQERQRQSMLESEIQFNDVIIQERLESIREIEAAILDINQMYRDLGMTVEVQGRMLDTIDANITKAAVHVDSGVNQLQQAEQHQRASRCKICCLLLVVLLVVAAIAVVLVLTVHR